MLLMDKKVAQEMRERFWRTPLFRPSEGCD
jgi:hypothetical protein